MTAPAASVAAVQKALAEHRVAGAYFASGDHEGVTCRCSLPFNSYDEWASHRAIAAADAAVQAATPGIEAGALRGFADTRGVNVGDEDDAWWRGYRQAQRECLHDAEREADRIETPNAP